jgi:inosose dehydratase
MDTLLLEGEYSMSGVSRREFIQCAGVGAAALTLSGRSGAAPAGGTKTTTSKLDCLKLGIASYTLRNMNLEQTLAVTKRLGLRYIKFKSMHLPLDSSPEKIKETLVKVKKAGIELYGGGVIYMKDEAAVHQAFDYAQAAGMKVIVGVPVYSLLKLVEKKVKETDIRLAIHNHGPTDKLYPTPESAYEKVKDMDPRMGICIDAGHTQRAGVNPADAIRKYADRLHDMDAKDVTKAVASGRTTEIGRGVIDIPDMLQALIDVKYSGIVALEYEKNPKDPVPGCAESIGYLRGVLSVI